MSSTQNRSEDSEKTNPTESLPTHTGTEQPNGKKRSAWKPWSGRGQEDNSNKRDSMRSDEGSLKRPKKWTGLGMLNDKETDEVPGTNRCTPFTIIRLTKVKAPSCYYQKCRIATNHLVFETPQLADRHPRSLLPILIRLTLRHGQDQLGPRRRNRKRREPKMERLCWNRSLRNQ